MLCGDTHLEASKLAQRVRQLPDAVGTHIQLCQGCQGANLWRQGAQVVASQQQLLQSLQVLDCLWEEGDAAVGQVERGEVGEVTHRRRNMGELRPLACD